MGKRLLDPDDLVTPAMIADDLGVGRAAVANYMTRHADFPEPVLSIGYTQHVPTALYSRQAVLAWARRTNHPNRKES